MSYRHIFKDNSFSYAQLKTMGKDYCNFIFSMQRNLA